MRLAYNDNYHMVLSMVLNEALCDNHVSCLSIAQDQTSLSLWISSHGKYNRKVHTNCERLVTVKGYLRIVWTFPGE